MVMVMVKHLWSLLPFAYLPSMVKLQGDRRELHRLFSRNHGVNATF